MCVCSTFVCMVYCMTCGVPEGCHHKAVVQCQGQRAGPEQARGDLQATNISE